MAMVSLIVLLPVLPFSSVYERSSSLSMPIISFTDVELCRYNASSERTLISGC